MNIIGYLYVDFGVKALNLSAEFNFLGLYMNIELIIKHRAVP